MLPLLNQSSLENFTMTTTLWSVLYKETKERDHLMTNNLLLKAAYCRFE